MNTYISLLRGINVGGNKKILMAELKALYEELGFSNIATYIQSGNVVFTSSNDNISKIKEKIEQGIEKKFGFEVKVLIKTPKQLEKALDTNPFEVEKMYMTFLFNIPSDISTEAIEKYKKSSEQYRIIEDVIYFYCPDGYANSKLSNNFFEKKLGVGATTRNLRTVNKLLEIST